MKWILLVGFTGVFQGSSMQAIEFEDEAACLAARQTIESEWDVSSFCLPTATQ